MNEQQVYERVLSTGNADAAGRSGRSPRDLLELSWVKDARVSRQLPDTLVIDVVERVPHAVLRKPNRLVLIDGEGEELEPIGKDNAKGMLIVSGPGAARRSARSADCWHPRPRSSRKWRRRNGSAIAAGTSCSTRGKSLALPQGERKSATALVNFARLDGGNRLLGGKVATFDMRAPERIYMRIPGRGAQELQSQGGE